MYIKVNNISDQLDATITIL